MEADYDVVPVRCEPPADGPPDPPAAAGDDGELLAPRKMLHEEANWRDRPKQTDSVEDT